ncbi:MAG TPA: AraC family transcriptional regulator [Burkholderiaceae bacterium]|nr:AraC family transcriptional regulator [Burkholderiaceae bacterium]
MRLEERGAKSLRLSTCELAVARRLPALRDLFDRSIGMDIDAEPGHPIDIQMNIAPGLRRARMLSPFTARAARPQTRLADGDDTVCLMIKTGGQMALSQGRHEGVPQLGDAVLLVYRQPSRLEFVDATYLSVRVPFAALAMLADVEAAAACRIPRHSAALALLQNYVGSLPEHLDDPFLGRLAATHVYDLMALAIGATDEGREGARGRGVRAARLEAIKTDLARDATLPIDQIARRQGVSTRYVQMLFEEQNTTFTEFAVDRRLDAALGMLTSPRYASWTIAGIALEAGFGDLSHFNRRFKRRFRATPTDVRQRTRDGPLFEDRDQEASSPPTGP